MAKTYFKLNDKQKASVAKSLREAEIRKLPPAARAAQRRANAIGQPVGYVGGSGHNSSSATYKGTVQPMGALPKFPTTQPAADTATTTNATEQTTAPAYDPTPLTIGGNTTETTTPTPEPEIKPAEPDPPMFMPGGAGTAVGGNAAGMRRKKSSGRLAGLTSKGPGQFKITGQSGKSSGLNIGV